MFQDITLINLKKKFDEKHAHKYGRMSVGAIRKKQIIQPIGNFRSKYFAAFVTSTKRISG